MPGPKVIGGPDPAAPAGEATKAFASVLDAMHASQQVNAFLEQVRSQERTSMAQTTTNLLFSMYQNIAKESDPLTAANALKGTFQGAFNRLQPGLGDTYASEIQATIDRGEFSNATLFNLMLKGPSTPGAQPTTPPTAAASAAPTAAVGPPATPPTATPPEVVAAQHGVADAVAKGAPPQVVEQRMKAALRAGRGTPEEQVANMLAKAPWLQDFATKNPEAYAHLTDNVVEQMRVRAAEANPLNAALAQLVKEGRLSPEQEATAKLQAQQLALDNARLAFQQEQANQAALTANRKELYDSLEKLDAEVGKIEAKYISRDPKTGKISGNPELLSQDPQYTALLKKQAAIANTLFPDLNYELTYQTLTTEKPRGGILGWLGFKEKVPIQVPSVTAVPGAGKQPSPGGALGISPPGKPAGMSDAEYNYWMTHPGVPGNPLK